jgi:hypothetical protein
LTLLSAGSPPLQTDLTGGDLALTWPAWAADYSLWSATNLSSTLGWSPVTNPPALTNSNLRVVLPVGPGDRYFRLQWP